MLLIFLSILGSSARIFSSSAVLPEAEPVVLDPEDCAVPALLVPGALGIDELLAAPALGRPAAPPPIPVVPDADPLVALAPPVPDTLPLCAEA
jgi:hypothetical protein